MLIEECNVTENLRIKVNHHKDAPIQLSQPCLLKRLIDSMPRMEGANPMETPTIPSMTLTKDSQGKHYI